MKKIKALKMVFPSLLWAASFAVFVRSLMVGLYDPDLWWHLSAGRWMAENKAILQQEVFSHTLYGTPWINFEWLSEIFLYGAVRGFGISAIYWGKIFFCLLALALLIYSIRKAGARGPWLLLLAWIGFKVLQPRLLERVELATLIFMPVFMALILRARAATSSSLRVYPWIFFSLMILWCNLHGGFIYGLALVVLFNLGARWAQERQEYLGMMDRSLVLVLGASLVNPYGPKIYGFLMEHLLQLKGDSFIQEWISPGVKDLPVFWFLFILSSLLLVWGLLGRMKEIKFWAIPLVVFAAWGGSYYRNTALFAFVGLPFLAVLIQRWTDLSPSASEGATKGAALLARWKTNGTLALLGWFLCLLPLNAHAALFKISFPKGIVVPDKVPAGACRFVRDNNLQGLMFNAYHYGGYIEWDLGPQRKVFQDGRYIFHSLAKEQAALNTELSRGIRNSRWTATLDKRRVSYAIMDYPLVFVRFVYNNPGFHFSLLNAAFPRSKWALVFWDDAALVFVRRTPENKAVIDKYEARFIWPYNLEQMKYFINSKTIAKDDVRRELERHEQEVGRTQIGDQLKALVN